MRERDKWTNLEVSALGLEPVVDEALRISGKTQHELSLGLQLVDGLDSLMDLCRVQKRRKINERKLTLKRNVLNHNCRRRHKTHFQIE